MQRGAVRRRLNWAIGAQQEPYFFYDQQTIEDHTPSQNEATLVTGIRWLIAIVAVAAIAWLVFVLTQRTARNATDTAVGVRD